MSGNFSEEGSYPISLKIAHPKFSASKPRLTWSDASELSPRILAALICVRIDAGRLRGTSPIFPNSKQTFEARSHSLSR